MQLLRVVLAGMVAVPLGLAGAHPCRAADAPEEPESRKPARERAIDVDLGWDQGPTYRIDLRLPRLEALDPTRLTEGFRFEGRIGGELFLEGGWVRHPGYDEGWSWDVRRIRLDTRGTLHRWVNTDYKVAFAIDDGKFFLNDFYVRWRPGHLADTVRLGYFDPPLSLQALAGTNDRGLAEVAAPVAAFAPGYRFGLDAHAAHEQPGLTWGASLTSVGQDRQQEADASDSALRVNGRLVWRPWYETGNPEGPSLLHVGASAGFTISGSGDIRYRARPESHLVDYLVDTGDIAGNAAVYALEAAWQRGPLSVQGEALLSRVNAEGANNPRFGGAYLQGSWVLTGEARPYDTAVAVFGRVAPRRPLAPRRGQWGAVEALLRLSWVDLSDQSVRGGEMITLSTGVAWTWNAWVRWKLDYTFADVSDGPRDGDVHVLSSRVELRF